MGRANVTVAVGSLFMFLAVLLGAFGAHALKARLVPEMLTVYQTGVQYHLFHALGLLLIGTMQDHANKHNDSRLLKLAAIFIAVGTVLFSGSLYILAITGVKGIGAITPVGGLCFLVGWALVAWQMLRRG